MGLARRGGDVNGSFAHEGSDLEEETGIRDDGARDSAFARILARFAFVAQNLTNESSQRTE